jgi:hypothetical protein
MFYKKTVECPSSALFGDVCNLSPCQCGTSNGLMCQSGICSYAEVLMNIKFLVC